MEIPGYENYTITRSGEVFSKKSNKILKRKISCGYYKNSLYKEGVSKTFYTHRLVAQTYLQKPDDKNKIIVNHINGIKLDNRVENLEYVTHKENSQHASDIGLLKNMCRPVIQIKINYLEGEKTYYSKMTEALQSGCSERSIRETIKNGKKTKNCLWKKESGKIICTKIEVKKEIIREYPSVNEASRQTGIFSDSIIKCCKKLNKTAGGYDWEYKTEIENQKFEDLTGIWKDIPKYPNYKISQEGKVYSLFFKKILSPYKGHNGYLRLSLRSNGKSRIFYVHLLVVSVFLEPKKSGQMVANHKDGNKTNNHVSNLEWVTRSENCQHAVDTGLVKSKYIIYQKDSDGNVIDTFSSYAKASAKMGCTLANVRDACTGRQKTACGFYWESKRKE